MNKNINDEKYRTYKKNRRFKIIYLLLSVMVIVLEVLALFNVISMVWGLLVFIFVYLLKKMF